MCYRSDGHGVISRLTISSHKMPFKSIKEMVETIKARLKPYKLRPTKPATTFFSLPSFARRFCLLQRARAHKGHLWNTTYPPCADKEIFDPRAEPYFAHGRWQHERTHPIKPALQICVANNPLYAIPIASPNATSRSSSNTALCEFGLLCCGSWPLCNTLNDTD